MLDRSHFGIFITEVILIKFLTRLQPLEVISAYFSKIILRNIENANKQNAEFLL